MAGRPLRRARRNQARRPRSRARANISEGEMAEARKIVTEGPLRDLLKPDDIFLSSVDAVKRVVTRQAQKSGLTAGYPPQPDVTAAYPFFVLYHPSAFLLTTYLATDPDVWRDEQPFPGGVPLDWMSGERRDIAERVQGQAFSMGDLVNLVRYSGPYSAEGRLGLMMLARWIDMDLGLGGGHAGSMTAGAFLCALMAYGGGPLPTPAIALPAGKDWPWSDMTEDRGALLLPYGGPLFHFLDANLGPHYTRFYQDWRETDAAHSLGPIRYDRGRMFV